MDSSQTAQGNGWTQGLESCVADHPFASTFASLATGFCVGLLLTRLLEPSRPPQTYMGRMNQMGNAVRDSLGRWVPASLAR